MKIIIDTNILLDFYRSKNESLEVLKLFKECPDKLIFPMHIYDEYRRKRLDELEKILNEIKLAKQIPFINNSVLINELPEVKEINAIKKSYNVQLGNLIEKVIEIKKDKLKDPIYKIIEQFIQNEKINKIRVTNEIVDAAKYRQLKGQPPGEKSKFNVGDQIIWESILSNVNQNIVLVTRDDTYNNNYEILAEEFYERTGFNFTITDKITDSFEKCGIRPKKKVREIEEAQIKYLKEHLYRYQSIPSTVHVKDGTYKVISGDLKVPSELNILKQMDFISDDSYIQIDKIIKED
ncbi:MULTISPECIES: PIN domain-containing protein [Paenibacillus]|uniref:PIN domain-containing protein n=1 Tax=Paenibacillus TaxID=44249 RepID=UPI0006766566|nr:MULTISPECIES: PIN domain-containing protein [Paenibacillus]UMY53501.1 PIN domain-containing protein [Paenibacillus peoriae]